MKYLNIIVVILIFICIEAQAQNAPFKVNRVGHETPTKPSLKNRLDGCREITVVYPNRLRNQTDRYLFGNLVYYFQKLGLQIHKVEVPYEVKQPAQGVVQYFRKDGFEEYLNNTNQLIVLPQLVSGFPDIEQFYIGIYDPVNDWAWEFNFEPKNKVDKYISQLASYITPQINYTPDKLMSFRPPFIVANWNNENDYRSAMASYGYDSYEGIYESDNYRAYLKKHSDGNYYFVYIGGCSYDFWKNGGGAVKSLLRPTATPGVFKADWWDAYGVRDKHSWNAVFSPGLITFIDSDGDKTQFLKMYPTSSESVTGTSEGEEWTGSGFALKNGYIVTNYHVIDGAKRIKINGVNGDFNTSYNAMVVGFDKINDLALLKISDSSFTGFGSIPYSISSNTSDVGEEIFVLGYPLTSTMGEEIKLTTGIISSKTGFQGDVALYQISAPIQPGNSGGPLFDKKGNVIGIVSAKHEGAENVGYAIKTMYLRNLVESCASASIIPATNTVSSLPLTGKVKSEKNFVFYIECSK
ncbi:MAG: serine protease [Muribaculaceae bacterium]|nr:serine protease [Muribaculaceae bacterium]